MRPHCFPHDTEVRLVPVIEMMPTDYARTEQPLVTEASPDEYFRYWSACLGEAGIYGLRPIRLWHVPLEQLSDVHTLEKVIQAHRFWDADAPEDRLDKFSAPEEYLSAFSGGYVLVINDSVICTPRCCADLGDISNWQESANHQSMEWMEIWIGHPSLQARFDGDYLVLRDQDEGDGRTEWDGEVLIRPQTLQEAIRQARQGLQEFSQRLLSIIADMVPLSQAVQITEILTGTFT